MKLMIGFAAGFAAGTYAYSKMTAEQRREISDKLDKLNTLVTQGRTGEVVNSVRKGVGDVADAMTDRVKGATEAAAEATTDAVSGDHDDVGHGIHAPV